MVKSGEFVWLITYSISPIQTLQFSLTIVILSYIHSKSTELIFACWQAWTYLSWPAWTWFLTGLIMYVGTECSWLDERTDFNSIVGTNMINQRRCSYMIEHVVMEWRNHKIERQRCYNHELHCCIKSGFACSDKREQRLLIRQAVTIF